MKPAITDLYGAIVKIEYPDNSLAEYTYNVLGRIETIKKTTRSLFQTSTMLRPELCQEWSM